MAVLLGVAALIDVLLAATALHKVAIPAPARRALRYVGLSVPGVVVRAAALVEALVAVGALLTGRPVFAALVAACYAGFAVFLAVGMRRPDRLASCGCFGGSDTPPSHAHVVFDVAAAGVAVAVTLRPVPGLAAGMGHQPLAGIPLLGLVALGCFLSWALLAVAPQTAAARAARAARDIGR